MEDMHVLVLGIGSNKGDRQTFLTSAIERLQAEVGEIRKLSQVYESAAWGDTSQPNFLNQVVIFHTHLSPYNCLAVCQKIENELGRERTKNRYDARTIDIDILYFDNLIIENKALLEIPHPRLHLRKFMLLPLKEIIPDYIHPILHKSQLDIFNSLKSTEIVSVYGK